MYKRAFICPIQSFLDLRAEMYQKNLLFFWKKLKTSKSDSEINRPLDDATNYLSILSLGEHSKEPI